MLTALLSEPFFDEPAVTRYPYPSDTTEIDINETVQCTYSPHTHTQLHTLYALNLPLHTLPSLLVRLNETCDFVCVCVCRLSIPYIARISLYPSSYLSIDAHGAEHAQ